MEKMENEGMKDICDACDEFWLLETVRVVFRLKVLGREGLEGRC